MSASLAACLSVCTFHTRMLAVDRQSDGAMIKQEKMVYSKVQQTAGGSMAWKKVTLALHCM